ASTATSTVSAALRSALAIIDLRAFTARSPSSRDAKQCDATADPTRRAVCVHVHISKFSPAAGSLETARVSKLQARLAHHSLSGSAPGLHEENTWRHRPRQLDLGPTRQSVALKTSYAFSESAAYRKQLSSQYTVLQPSHQRTG